MSVNEKNGTNACKKDFIDFEAKGWKPMEEWFIDKEVALRVAYNFYIERYPVVEVNWDDIIKIARFLVENDVK